LVGRGALSGRTEGKKGEGAFRGKKEARRCCLPPKGREKEKNGSNHSLRKERRKRGVASYLYRRKGRLEPA